MTTAALVEASLEGVGRGGRSRDMLTGGWGDSSKHKGVMDGDGILSPQVMIMKITTAIIMRITITTNQQ